MSTQQQCMVLNIPDWLKERKTLLHYWVARHEELNWRVEKIKADCRRSAEVSPSAGGGRLKTMWAADVCTAGNGRGGGGWRRSRRRWVLNLVRRPAVTLASRFPLVQPDSPSCGCQTEKVNKVSIRSTIQQCWWRHSSGPSWPLGVATVQPRPPP